MSFSSGGKITAWILPSAGGGGQAGRGGSHVHVVGFGCSAVPNGGVGCGVARVFPGVGGPFKPIRSQRLGPTIFHPSPSTFCRQIMCTPKQLSNAEPLPFASRLPFRISVLPTETKVESGTSQSKSEPFVGTSEVTVEYQVAVEAKVPRPTRTDVSGIARESAYCCFGELGWGLRLMFFLGLCLGIGLRGLSGFRRLSVKWFGVWGDNGLRVRGLFLGEGTHCG